MFRVASISVGLNDYRSSSRVLRAENDARAFRRWFSGSAVPAPGDHWLLVGAGATARNLDTTFAKVRRAHPDYLIFTFAGHGTAQGPVLKHGVYDYSRLLRQIRRVGVERSLVLIDACHAGRLPALAKGAEIGGLDGLRERARQAFSDALIDATPGVRVVVATREHEVAGEGRIQSEHGDFSAAMLAAFAAGKADMLASGFGFVSDTGALLTAAKVLRGVGAPAPYVLQHAGRTPMPVNLSQSLAPIGTASIFDLEFERDALRIGLSLDERRALVTTLRVDIHSDQGWIGSYSAPAMATETEDWETIRLSLHEVLEHPWHRLMLDWGHDVRVWCTVAVLDRCGRVLARRRLSGVAVAA